MEAIRRKDASNVARKIREIYVPKEEIDDSKLFESCAVICVNGMYVNLKMSPRSGLCAATCVLCMMIWNKYIYIGTF